MSTPPDDPPTPPAQPQNNDVIIDPLVTSHHKFSRYPQLADRVASHLPTPPPPDPVRLQTAELVHNIRHHSSTSSEQRLAAEELVVRAALGSGYSSATLSDELLEKINHLIERDAERDARRAHKNSIRQAQAANRLRYAAGQDFMPVKSLFSEGDPPIFIRDPQQLYSASLQDLQDLAHYYIGDIEVYNIDVRIPLITSIASYLGIPAAEPITADQTPREQAQRRQVPAQQGTSNDPPRLRRSERNR